MRRPTALLCAGLFEFKFSSLFVPFSYILNLIIFNYSKSLLISLRLGFWSLIWSRVYVFPRRRNKGRVECLKKKNISSASMYSWISALRCIREYCAHTLRLIIKKEKEKEQKNLYKHTSCVRIYTELLLRAFRLYSFRETSLNLPKASCNSFFLSFSIWIIIFSFFLFLLSLSWDEALRDAKIDCKFVS